MPPTTKSGPPPVPRDYLDAAGRFRDPFAGIPDNKLPDSVKSDENYMRLRRKLASKKAENKFLHDLYQACLAEFRREGAVGSVGAVHRAITRDKRFATVGYSTVNNIWHKGYPSCALPPVKVVLTDEIAEAAMVEEQRGEDAKLQARAVAIQNFAIRISTLRASVLAQQFLARFIHGESSPVGVGVVDVTQEFLGSYLRDVRTQLNSGKLDPSQKLAIYKELRNIARELDSSAEQVLGLEKKLFGRPESILAIDRGTGTAQTTGGAPETVDDVAHELDLLTRGLLRRAQTRQLAPAQDEDLIEAPPADPEQLEEQGEDSFTPAIELPDDGDEDDDSDEKGQEDDEDDTDGG